jgi:hypothetical protein
MKKSIGKYITTIAFVTATALFFVLNFAIETPAILESERRAPASFPELTAKTFIDDSFMEGFDEWATDTFAFREGFRTLRAHMVFNVFQQTDKEGHVGAQGPEAFAERECVGRPFVEPFHE